MVRTYIKKRNKPEVSEENISKAMQAVKDGMSLRSAADLHGMHYSALFYRLKKYKAFDVGNNPTTASKSYISKYTSNQVFTAEQENMLCDYIIKSSNINYGLTYKQVRQFAFDYAKCLKLNMPINWGKNKIAGIDWVKGFMRRHQELTLRKPENTSLSRATAFNKANVAEFFANYERAIRSDDFTAESIYNLDETGVSTVLQAPRVIAKLGARQVGQVVSGERGTMITVCLIVNAVGNTVPPVFVFPRAKFQDSMLFGAPEGSLGLVNNPKSGWMTSALFLNVLEHVKKHTKCTKENKILLLMDNHESHCSLDAILFARENGIVLVTFPPHCTHRLQPLDVGVMGPFKSKLKAAQNDWMVSNPGKTISIHNLAALINTAYISSFTAKNIIAAFKATGTWPFSILVFTDEDFAASRVDNSSVNSPALIQQDLSDVIDSPPVISYTSENRPSTSKEIPTTLSSTPKQLRNFEISTNNMVLTPEDVRPLPKVESRINKVGRKKGKSKILTETPEKNRVEEETIKRLQKRSKLGLKKVKCGKSGRKIRYKPTKKILFNESSDSECEKVSLQDESEYEDLEQVLISKTSEFEETMDFENDNSIIRINDFVLVEFAGKKNRILFIGQVEDKEENTYKVKFMRRKEDSWKFSFPERDDFSIIERDDIKMKLPQPNISGGTSRAISTMTFPVNFSSIEDKIM